MANKMTATFGLPAIAAVLVLLAVAACSSGNSPVADAAESSSSGSAVISSSARQAISEILGDVDSPGPEATREQIPERIPGVSYGPTEPGVVESSVDSERNLLRIKLQGTDGGRVSMKNGGVIRLREGLVAEIFVDPFPTHTLTAWIDLYLHDGAGSEFKDVKVVIDYDMFSMGHGPFFSVADKSPNGHYTFRLDYVMFGRWIQILEIQDPETDEEHTLEVIVVAVP